MNPKCINSESKQQVICFQQLNDISGSPMVLSLVIKGLISRGYKVALYTSDSPKDGLLSGIPGLEYHYHHFYITSSKIRTFLSYIWIQIKLGLKLLKYRHSKCVFYVNTVVPFGATIMGCFLKKKVIVHVHETSIRPRIFMNFLITVIKKCSTHVIYVSKYLIEQHPTVVGHMTVIPNSLTDEFVSKASLSKPSFMGPFNILMVCSFKEYKGINEFVQLAQSMSDMTFTLVLNASLEDTKSWRDSLPKLKNLNIYGPQHDLNPFYSISHVVLNLSHPDKWVETFGLTILEALAYSVPVIVPNCGGIMELVESGVNGYTVSVYDLDLIEARLRYITSDITVYTRFSEMAYEKSLNYSSEKQMDGIEAILTSFV